VAKERKQPVTHNQNRGSSEQERKLHRNNIQSARSKIIKEGEWRNSGYINTSECSTVSSDPEFEADVPVVLPSVKELAKHFAGGTSDSDSSVTKVSIMSKKRI